jgi:hypothetical protein
MIVPANPKMLQYLPKAILQKPFSLLLGFMCAVSGPTYIFGNQAGSAGKFLPIVLTKSWGFCLTIGGILLVIGILRTNPLIQRAGLSLLAPTALVYAIILVVYVGITSIFSATIIVAFSLACAIEDYTIKIATNSIRQVFKDHPSG